MMPAALKVLLGTTLLGLSAGVVGCLAVLRRRALVGDVLAHAALPGICLAFLFLGQRQVAGLLLGGLLAGLVALVVMNLVSEATRTKPDAALAVVLSTFCAFGVVLLSVIQRRPGGANQAGLASYIFGQAAALTQSDVQLLALVSAAALAITLLLFKEFQLLGFDPDFAQSQGWPRRWLDFAMMGTLAVVTVAGLPAVGVVLMAALLIIPGAAARFWSDRFGYVLLLAGGLGATACALGTAISAGWHRGWWGAGAEAAPQAGLPTGPLIVLAAVALFLVSALLAPQRGAIARWWVAYQLRRRVAAEHLLRAMYEIGEPHLPERPLISRPQLAAQRSWTGAELARSERVACRAGWIERQAGQVRLTPQGLAQAAEWTRRHRLWELYLIEGAQVASGDVDRQADQLEHWLSDDLVTQLQQELVDRNPAVVVTARVPPSPHQVDQTQPRQAGNQPGEKR